VLGGRGWLADVAAQLVYAHDASHLTLGRPQGVALPASVTELQQVIAACAAAGVPLVPRGSGSGLSGGAVPPDGAIVLGLGRLQRIGPVDRQWGRVEVQGGVLNEAVSRAAAPFGYHFAPDPSSQSVSSIGGNVAENAGGPHCLRHGVTLHHLHVLHWVGPDGRLHRTGLGTAGERGLDLVSLLCGSEGTLGVVTSAELGLVRLPAAETTLLAFFTEMDAATGAVVDLLGQGLLPVAVEMVDQAMLCAVEEAFGFGFPTDAAAALIVEFHGTGDEVAEDGTRAADHLRRWGAREIRLAVDTAERLELWKCRKQAFGAVGRLAPCYVTMDVVVPLGELPDFVAEIQRIKARHGVSVATAFHAGDGNLHPGVCYDDRDPDQTRCAHAAADEIIAAGLARGGSATGEHGVGLEKLHVLPWQMDAVTARLHHDLKRVCDPAGRLNPGKLLPDPAARYAALKPVPTSIVFRPDCLTVTAPADTRLSALQDLALARGLWVPLGLPGTGDLPGLAHDPRLVDLLDHLSPGPALFAAGTTREYLLESWAETGTGEVFHGGAPVFKNVAGYGLHHMLCGSGGMYARHLAATLQLRPRPECAQLLHLVTDSDAAPGLGQVWEWLGRRQGTTAGSWGVFDPPDGLFLLLAGRDRSWDLGRSPAAAIERLGPAGWRLAEHRLVPFAEAVVFLESGGLPAWALGGTTWSSLAPRPGAVAEPALPVAMPFVRQAVTGRTWVPGVAESSDQWQVDVVLKDGTLTLPPPPPAGVPLSLLRGIKNVLDPHGCRPTPEWLTRGEEPDE
jgi:glycolate oxidase